MTIQEILSNEPLRHHEFPVTQNQVFLAHAAVTPLPRRVADAVNRYAADATGGDQEAQLPQARIAETRALAARLTGADSGEIALVGPTSIGLSLIAAGLPWKAGDNVLFYGDDYPSNVYPWLALAERGVKPRRLNTSALGRIQTEDVLGQLDARTRLVALASCHFISGHRINIDEIGAALQARGIAFCVDAIQTLGAFPTPIDQVDFLAADAHKWLLGPCAIGVLFVRRSRQADLRPALFGWHNVACPEFVAGEELRLRNDARRYEAGSHNLLGIVGFHAALQLILELGVEAIAHELLRKRAWLIPALQEKGFRVLEADADSERASAIISFFREGADMRAVHQGLLKAHIITSLRTDRTGRHFIRLSPHFYNTDGELRRLLDLL